MSKAGTITVTAKAACGTKDILKEFMPLSRAEPKRARRLAGEPEWSTTGPTARTRSCGQADAVRHVQKVCRSGATWWTPWMSRWRAGFGPEVAGAPRAGPDQRNTHPAIPTGNKPTRTITKNVSSRPASMTAEKPPTTTR